MKNSMNTDLIYNKMKEHINEDAAIIQKIELPSKPINVNVFIKREDLLHSTISGNKWRKLKYNLIQAHNDGYQKLLTFGGAYSNHIHATASACKMFGFKTIGIIRGEEHLPHNPTLKFAKECGMQIHYVNRSEYRRKREEDFISDLRKQFGHFYLLPEGGTNQLAIKGCIEIINDIKIDYDYICSACGTGGTLSGIICGLAGKKKVIGIPVLKGAGFLNKEITKYINEYSQKEFTNWELKLDYHCGGYAKINKDLIEFILEFEKINNIQLDPVYTGKLLFGIQLMIKNGEIPDNSTILAIHTGGLQGRAGMENKINKLLS